MKAPNPFETSVTNYQLKWFHILKEVQFYMTDLLNMHSNELQPRRPGIYFRQKGLGLSFFTGTQLALSYN